MLFIKQKLNCLILLNKQKYFSRYESSGYDYAPTFSSYRQVRKW